MQRAVEKIRIKYGPYWQLYLFLLVPLVWLIVFKYIPMAGVQLAFRKYTIKGGIWNSPWVGLKNFDRFFSSYQFERVLTNTLSLSLYGLIAGFPFPILLALCLNTMVNQKLKKTVQMITYAPYFISTVVLVGMMLSIFNSRTGLYGHLYYRLMGEFPTDFMSKAKYFQHIYVWSGIWQGVGWGAIIYISALSGVDDQLHEAAMIDGASRFKRVIYIDLPHILPTAAIMLILNAGSIMSVGFQKVYLLQTDLNLRASEIISTYVYKVGLTGSTDYSLSTTIDLFNSVINMTLLVLVNYASGKLSGNQLF